jgi:lipopolysaccharide assembly outer membrane protein LptD (OstA)
MFGIAQQDTASIKQDTMSIKSPSGIDSIITFYATDSIDVNLQTQVTTLYGNASIEMGNRKLTASIIEIHKETSTLKARLTKDSTGKAIGIPCMNENGEEFFGEELTYNMKTNTGTIKAGETKMGEGYYFGTSINRISKNELYIKDGYYTTCDAPAPHYHFGSSEMKMQVGEKLFADPLYLYVEDIPIFVIPLGLYLPMEHGRRSGLIVPSFYFSNDRGVVFQNFGFYWAASDYWDTKFTADIYTKGGYIINNSTQWALKNIFSGNASISFGNTRYNIDDKFSKEWKLALTHNHTFTPFESANINLNFSSSDFNRNTSTNINNRIEQSIHSGASYSRTFENGINASLSFQNDQNIITNEYTGTVPLSVSIPQVQLVKKLFNVPANNWYSWVRDITVAYRGNAMYNFNKRMGTINSYQTDTGIVYDTLFNSDATGYITHSPTISISPKFGYFNITPSISLGANNYFRKIIKTYNSDTDSLQEEFQRGVFTEYNYSFGIGASTRLYGIADSKRYFLGILDPNLIGVKAIRHTYQPSINFSYSPDFSGENYGFYGHYKNNYGNEVKYSYFEKEGGAHASSSLQQRISYSDMHSIEIKRQGKDTLPDENMELLRLTLNLSHNFAADTLKFSDLSTTFRTPALKYLDLSGNANFTIYDEQINPQNNQYHRINQFLLSNGKGLARLTNAGFSVSTTFSSNGISNGLSSNTSTDTTADSTIVAANSLGGRFLRTDAFQRVDDDIFGEHSSGYSDFNMPWSITVALTFNYSRQTIDRIDRRLNLNTSFNFTLAATWKVSTTFQYDFISKQMLTPQVNLTKDLHCWDLTASWYPSGYNAGFYLRFGIKSAQLRDMKIEKRDSPIFR